MEDFWLRALRQAEQAEEKARQLRAQFGRDAEARCLEELQRFPPSDPRRHSAEDVRRALRWT